MHFAITIALLFLTNSLIYSYIVASSKLGYTGWKIFLIPLILFPIIYLANTAFSGAFIFGPKGNLSIATIGIINIAVWTIVVLSGHIFYYKQSLDSKMIIGSILVTAGAILVSLKST